MNRTEALESLAEKVVFGTATPDTLQSLRLSLREGKDFEDVLNARRLQGNQQPGDFDRMLSHVENNLAEVIA